MTLPAPSWSSAARACWTTGAPQSSCGSHQYCLPDIGPFCIKHPDDVPCPTVGEYRTRRVYYQGSSDQRDCTPCSCDAPSGASCSFPPAANLVVGSFGTGCSIPTGQPFFVPLTCAPKVPSAFALALLMDAGLDAGACPPSGGAPDGAVIPTTPTTFCCTR